MLPETSRPLSIRVGMPTPSVNTPGVSETTVKFTSVPNLRCVNTSRSSSVLEVTTSTPSWSRMFWNLRSTTWMSSPGLVTRVATRPFSSTLMVTPALINSFVSGSAPVNTGLVAAWVTVTA